MFVQAAVEDLPFELEGIASEIYINFPWGSLLRRVAKEDGVVLESLRSLLTKYGSLTVTMGIDLTRDLAELTVDKIKAEELAKEIEYSIRKDR